MKRRINEGRLKKEAAPLDEDEEDLIDENIRELLSLRDYMLPTLRIKSVADEEQVAEIFKRVNSGGQNLNENNFIETLLAVYDNEVHDSIMRFCADSRVPGYHTSYNHIIDVDSSHLIRMAVGVGFRRARLSYAYKLMRGRDLETGVVSEQTRGESLAKFKQALDTVTNLNNWHAFLNLFGEAGYLRSSLLSSKYVVVFGYILYLVGKYDYNVPMPTLRKVMTLWIFMSTVTSFYSSSPESTVEAIFADLRRIHTASDFVAYLMKEIELRMTEDFFSVTLPENLSSSAAISPAWYAYLASLNVLGAHLLFSTTPASKYWLPGTHGTKSSIDKHHIFPKNYLAKIGVTSDRDRNQIANFTYLDYGTNIDISDNPPSMYVEKYRSRLGDEVFARSLEENAIPQDFGHISYQEFLGKRRRLMAATVRRAYLVLRGM